MLLSAANGMAIAGKLDKKDYKKYITELKKIKVFDNILDDTYQRKIKKIMLKISPKLYYKVVK